jgi:mannose-6-phosphate isomerase
MTSVQAISPPSISLATDRLRRWTIEQALPLWGREGFDPAQGSFIERFDFNGVPMAAVPRRAMVQARQVYVFSHAALLGWWPPGREIALAAAHGMIDRYHRAGGNPGWAFSARPDGAVHDATRHLYTQCFALFGLAWAYRLAPEPRFRAVADQTMQDLDQYFAASCGGYHSMLPPQAGQLHQNPHMHLFEAMLAWFEATGDEVFLTKAGALRSLMAERFFQPQSGILPEYFNESWIPVRGVEGRICEPGHHFEWSWLLQRYATLAGRLRDPVADALKLFASRHGFDAAGLVVDELLDDGSVHKASRRCWPHTEAIKAEVALFEAGDAGAGARAAQVIDRLMEVFLGRPVAGGWIDHIDANGAPRIDFMPASTLYHVFLAAAEAHRVWA